jgi:hypothetical protein
MFGTWCIVHSGQTVVYGLPCNPRIWLTTPSTVAWSLPSSPGIVFGQRVAIVTESQIQFEQAVVLDRRWATVIQIRFGTSSLCVVPSYSSVTHPVAPPCIYLKGRSNTSLSYSYTAFENRVSRHEQYCM